ncbi:MAG: hypothetical protein R3F35_15510 [Myxococcota bacterium]
MVDLGSLPAGTCDVSIQTDRATLFGASLWDSARLSSTVVPEPATSALIAMGRVGLPARIRPLVRTRRGR